MSVYFINSLRSPTGLVLLSTMAKQPRDFTADDIAREMEKRPDSLDHLRARAEMERRRTRYMQTSAIATSSRRPAPQSQPSWQPLLPHEVVGDGPHPQTRRNFAPVRRVERRRLQRACRWRCRRPHHEGRRCARGSSLGCGRSRSATTKTARQRTAYSATREGAMAAFAKSWRRPA